MQFFNRHEITSSSLMFPKYINLLCTWKILEVQISLTVEKGDQFDKNYQLGHFLSSDHSGQ